MERNNHKSSYDVSSNVSDRLDPKQIHKCIIRYELRRIIDIVCHVLDKIVQYPEVLPFEEVLSKERIARPFDYYILNILNKLTRNLTEYKVVPHQLYKLAYVGISIENRNRKGEQLEGFKEIFLIISRVLNFDLYESNSIEYLDHYVRLLKLLEAKRPYCIIYFIPTLINEEKYDLNFLINIMTCSDDIFAKKIESMNKLTLEIENLTTPVVAIASDSLSDMELNSFLASHYRICRNDEPSIQLTLGWITSFMMGGILRRLSQLSSPILAFKLLDSIFEDENFIFLDSRSLLFHGVIDAFDEKRNTLIDWRFDKELLDYALYEVLNVDFQKLKNKRAKTAEARFLNLEPNSSFWDEQFEDFMIEKGTTYESIFKTSILYLKEFLAHGIERANEYEIELALKRRNSAFGRSGLDLAYSLCIQDYVRFKVPESAVIAIIGFNLLEYLALFHNSGYSMNCIRNSHGFTFDYFGGFKFYIVSELEVLKRHKRIDLVLITQTFEEYVHVHDMLKIIEDNIPPDTPICVGIFCEDLFSIKKQAKHPERIIGLHLWPLNRRTFVANVLNINWDVKSKPYTSKVEAIMRMFDALCIQTVIRVGNNELFFIRSLFSILSEVSRQAVNNNMGTLFEVINAILVAGINPKIILVANILGFDLLLRYVSLFQSENQRLGVEWNFDTLHHLIEMDAEQFSFLRDLYDMPYPSIDFDIGYRLSPSLPNFTERTTSMQNPSSTKILLSSFIEPIKFYVKNAPCINEDYLQILNYGITAVCCYTEIEAGPFRVIDEYLHLYADIINNNDGEFKFLKLWLETFAKFFSNSPHR